MWIDIARYLAAIALVAGSLELLASPLCEPAGLLGWNIHRTGRKLFLDRRLGPAFSALLSGNGLQLLIALRCLTGILLAVPRRDGAYYAASAMVALAITLLLNLRSTLGNEGADQMEVIVLAGTASFYIFRGSPFADAGVLFVAFQSCLAYSVSGVAKIMSPVWRTGVAIRDVMNSVTYGHRRLGGLLSRNKSVALCAGLATIGLELCLGLTPFMPHRVMFPFLACGVVFHGLIAYTMGLNKFFWVFVSTYPYILCASDIITGRNWPTLK